VEYGSTTAKLPALLEAVRRGDNMVRLDDGAYGMLPEEWLRRIGLVAGMGAAENGHIKLPPQPGGVAGRVAGRAARGPLRPEAFARVREEMRQFQGVEAAAQPAGFVGQLRDYQREGLGWMEFLRRFSFGGCLADDMGVGKTAQVLALLEARRELRAAGNDWPVAGGDAAVAGVQLEAGGARFTPQLRVLDYTGLARQQRRIRRLRCGAHHLRHAAPGCVPLKDVEFDYVILDEAQAVKNAGTESAKAVRLLRGNIAWRSAALPWKTIWASFGRCSSFSIRECWARPACSSWRAKKRTSPGEETRQMLAGALRPFILRRTKEQVARELPLKTEQTVFCEMEPVQRKLYNELRSTIKTRCCKRIETARLGEIEDSGARSAAAFAPGRVPSRA
jgi:SNF2 family DNA or RNA helicase